MTLFEKIRTWNEERGLPNLPFDHQKQVSFIIEELLESTGNHDSISAREKAEEISHEITKDAKFDPETVIDAFGDIIVFSVGVMLNLGYNPDQVMDEIYKEINSRTGKIIDGKFVKNVDVERYYADFSICKTNQ